MAGKETASPTIYFGYGSNLWREQMTLRCPTSTYRGIARLRGYRWIINERGYANVVETKTPEDSSTASTAAVSKDNVWGLVYALQPSDEARLDVNEGVPHSYTKEMLECEFWPADNDDDDDGGGGGDDVENDESALHGSAKRRPAVAKDMLVYISRDFVKPSPPKKEYIYRMNMGIADALELGVPRGYVNGVLRRFIPDVQDGTVREVAREQALEFRDERWFGE